MTEIRLNDNGTLDEIVGTGRFHLEQMDDDEWFLELDGVALFLVTKNRAHIRAHCRDFNSWAEARPDEASE